jgi:hypothetical protein
MGMLKRVFDNFSKYKSREGGYRVIFGSTLHFSVENIYKGVTYVKLKDMRQTLGTNEEKEYKIYKFTAHYEIAKFTADQLD